MANHYLSIGFVAPERMAVVELLRRAIKEGASEDLVEGGRFVRLEDHASGARVNVLVDHTGMLRSAKPSFAASVPRRNRFRVTGLHPDPANPEADLVQLAPVDGDYPLAVEFEDGSRAISALAFGEEEDIELVGFADTLECYPHEGAYRASGMPLGTKEVLPAGLVPLATPDGMARARAAALVSGIVVECSTLRNELGGAEFLHLVIETDAMTFDAVVAPDAVEGPPPAPGRIVTGSLWFVARRPQLVSCTAPAATAAASEDGDGAAHGTEEAAARPRPRLFSRWA